MSSVALIVILARLLDKPAYSAYIAFQAIIGILEVITTFGIQRVLFRYLPELRATGNHLAAYRLLANGMLIRSIVVTPLFIVAAIFSDQIAAKLNIGEFAYLLPWYMLFGYVRIAAGWLSQCIESFLWQKESQYTMAAGGIATLVVLAFFILTGDLQLVDVVIAESIGAVLSMVMLLYFWYARWSTDPDRHEGTTTWWQENRSRAIRFGAWGFALQQSRLLYGSSPNRLLLAYFLPGAQLATFGLADHMYRIANRFMPATTFSSMVRPIAMARYAATNDFREVVRISDLTYRLNLLLLVPPIVVMFLVGEPIFSWISDGKYGPAGPLFAGFLILMVAEGTRTIVELLITALEKNNMFFWTNLVQSASLLLAIPLIPSLGAWSVIVANVLGTILANTIVITRIRREGYDFKVSLKQIFVILFYGAVSAAVGAAALQLSGSVIVTTIAILVSFAAACLLKPPFLQSEIELFRSLLQKRGKKRANPPI